MLAFVKYHPSPENAELEALNQLSGGVESTHVMIELHLISGPFKIRHNSRQSKSGNLNIT